MVPPANDALLTDIASASEARLEALRRTQLLDTPPEPAFDQLTELACRVLQVPISFVALLDGNREFLKSACGLPQPWAARREFPPSHSFARHLVASGQPLVINDTRSHPLVRDNPALQDPGVIAYLGAPLFTPDGYVVGSLCAVDHVPRAWSEDDVGILSNLASTAMAEIARRMERRDHEEEYRALFEQAGAGKAEIDTRTGRFLRVNRKLCDMTGYNTEELLQMSYKQLVHPEDLGVNDAFARAFIGAANDASAGCRFIHKLGHVRWTETNLSVVRRATGQPSYAIASIQDITEHKRALDRTELLQRVGAALYRSITPDQVAQVIMRESALALNAAAGSVYAASDDAATWNLIASTGYSEEALARNGLLQLSSPASASSDTEEAGQLHAPMSQDDLAARYARLPIQEHGPGHQDCTVLPLKVEGRTIGVIVLVFAETQRVEAEDHDFASALAGQCAQALERARIYEAEQRAHAAADAAARTSSFLAQTSQSLTASLDFDTCLRTVTRLAVPFLADWCTVNFLELDGTIRPVNVAHIQPEKMEQITRWAERYLLQPGTAPGIQQVFQTGQSVFLPDISDAHLDSLAGGDALLRQYWQETESRSMIIVPLTIYGHTFGALTLARAESGRRYGPDDLALAEEWARHAVLPVDNARLYRTLQVLNTELEQRVVQRTAELNASHNQLRRLAARLQAAREEERTRIAREVHDVIGQLLTALKMDVATLGRQLEQENSPAAARVKDINELLDSTIKSVRRVATELRPSILDDLGLVAAVEWQLREFGERSKIACDFACSVDEIPMDSEKSTAVFRLVQEALTNVARHAQASEVRVELQADNGNLSIEIQDNGRGITEQELRGATSLGLLGMRERMHLLGGQLEIHGRRGQGTTVSVRVPLATTV